MTMGDPNGTNGKSLEDGEGGMDSDEEEAPPNVGAEGQGTIGGQDNLAWERRDRRAVERLAW